MKVKLNGVTLNCTERGLPQGLPVVFIHGFPFSHAMWEPQMKALPNNIRAITYDVRGHGESDVGDGQYTIEIFVDDLMALLDHLVQDKVVLCGLSMGGYIALRAFERHPDRIRGLVLCDTQSAADSNEGKVKRTASVKAVKNDGVKAFAEGFVKAVFAEKTLRQNPGAVGTIRTVIESTSPVGICGTLIALAARTDTTSSLANIRVPTLILVGAEDKITPPSASESMRDRIAASEMHLIPNAAHLSNFENAEAFNEHLITFLKKLG